MKLITPISHLFRDASNIESITCFSDELEAREKTCNLRLENTTHYHIDFDLNLGLNDKQIKFLEDEVKPRDSIQTITFQATRDYENTKIIDGMYYPNGQKIELNEQLVRTSITVKKIRDIIGSNRIIGIENNNYYPTGAYDIATSSDYLIEAANKNNLKLLFDFAHAKITCTNKKISFNIYSNKLIENIKCIQMHLCENRTRLYNNEELAYDAHELPTKETTNEALNLCNSNNIKSLTIEYYKNADNLTDYLKKLKLIINKK